MIVRYGENMNDIGVGRETPRHWLNKGRVLLVGWTKILLK